MENDQRGLPYPTPYEVERVGIMKCVQTWNKSNRRQATVHGIPSITGAVIASNGPMAIVERADGELFIVHRDNLVYDKAAAPGRGVNASRTTASARGKTARRKAIEQEYQ